MPNPFSPRMMAKAADEAAEFVYVTTEDFGGTGVYEVVGGGYKLIENNDGEFWRAIIELECVAHENEDVVGRKGSFLRDPQNRFHQKELLSFVGALKHRLPQNAPEVFEEVFALNEDEEAIPYEGGGKVGMTIKPREGKQKPDGTIPVFWNPTFFAVDDDNNRIAKADLA